jgi:hypothetical protein
MAGATDKYKMLSLHFILVKRDHTKITKHTNVWLDKINVSNL